MPRKWLCIGIQWQQEVKLLKSMEMTKKSLMVFKCIQIIGKRKWIYDYPDPLTQYSFSQCTTGYSTAFIGDQSTRRG